jgi:hypothetical protein
LGTRKKNNRDALSLFFLEKRRNFPGFAPSGGDPSLAAAVVGFPSGRVEGFSPFHVVDDAALRATEEAAFGRYAPEFERLIAAMAATGVALFRGAFSLLRFRFHFQSPPFPDDFRLPGRIFFIGIRRGAHEFNFHQSGK